MERITANIFFEDSDMIRTLIFGAIAGIVGKKLYDSGKLDEFVGQAKERLDEALATTREPAAASGPADRAAPNVPPPA